MFELTKIPAKITSFTGRTETHGKEKVPALSFGLLITTGNTILDALFPGLRLQIYKGVEELDQAQIDGVEPSTPLLRNENIEIIRMNKMLEGWAVIIDHGIDDETQIELGTCKIDNFAIEAYEGGSIDLAFRVGTSNCDWQDAGLLWSKNGQDVVLTVRAPEVQAEPIDGSVGAFEKDHPEAGKPLDMTQAFIDTAGDRED